MFSHKINSTPSQNYRIDSHPTIEQITEMMEKARGVSGVRHNYLWEIPKDFKKFTLSLHCKEGRDPEAEIEWWLHEENVVGTKMHWFHKTKDIAVIYPHLLAATGEKHPLAEETPEEKAKQEREKEKPTSLGERLIRGSLSADTLAQAQSGAQVALKPPPGFFGQSAPGSDTASGAYSAQSQSGAFPAQTPFPSPQFQSGSQVPLRSVSNHNNAQAHVIPGQSQERDFFEIGAPSSILPYDSAAVQEMLCALTNKQTGAYTSQAFQYFLEREFARAFRFSSEFSLLVFCIRLGGSNESSSAGSIPMKSLALTIQAIFSVKRDVDVLGHVGDRAFGLILPGVGTNQSMALIERISLELPKLAPKLGGFWPILHFGVAGVPEDARDLPRLMKSAQEAMIEAARKNYSRIRSSDLNS